MVLHTFIDASDCDGDSTLVSWDLKGFQGVEWDLVVMGLGL